MSDQREALVQAIVHATEANWDIAEGHAGLSALADALLAEFLIVPRSDIQGYEYGVRSTRGGTRAFVARDSAVVFLAKRREAQIRVVGSSDAEVVERPILPWAPSPEGGDGNG